MVRYAAEVHGTYAFFKQGCRCASCVMYWERGEKRPSLVHFIGWAEVLGYDVRLQRPAGQPEVTAVERAVVTALEAGHAR